MNFINTLFRFVLNRNFILGFAVVMGFAIGEYAEYIKQYIIFILGLTMLFSTTGISTKALFPLKNLIKPILVGTFLNYIVFGSIVISLAWLVFGNSELFIGFVVIVAAPPGVAVIPFTSILNGDIKYAIIGVLGAFIASIFIAPVLVGAFPGGESVDVMKLFVLMIELVLVPMVLSRFLLHKSIVKTVEKIRGKVVDWGFALIIFTAVGMNKNIIFSDSILLIKSLVVLITAIFVSGSLFEYFAKKMSIDKGKVTAQTLLLTIKSSGFSVVTALTLFGEKAAIPSAVLAIIVLLYLLFLSIRFDLKKQK